MVCFYKIINGEVVFAFIHARTAADNLLKLDHVVTRAHQYDVTHIAGINAGRKLA